MIIIFSLNVIVNPTAQVDQPLDQVICNGDTTSIDTTENTGGTTTYAWINNTPSIGLSEVAAEILQLLQQFIT